MIYYFRELQKFYPNNVESSLGSICLMDRKWSDLIEQLHSLTRAFIFFYLLTILQS